MATTNDDSAELTVPDLRSRLIAAAHSEAGDLYGSRPLVEETQRRLYFKIEGEKIPEDFNSNQVRYKLLNAVGQLEDAAQYLERGNGPLRKRELRAIWNEVRPEDSWGPVGSEDLEQEDDSRELRKPEATERRFQVLAALAVNGPCTANELAEESEVPRESITSELPRLYRDYMAGRTKRETFEDVFKYWVRPEGYRVIQDVVETGSMSDHEELHELYGDNR